MDQQSKTTRDVSGSAKALTKGLALVDLLAAHPRGLRLAEVIRRADVPKATALRLLDALTEAGLVRCDDAGVYRLGAQCAVWGSAFIDHLDLRGEAADLLAHLAEVSGETAHLGIIDGARMLYIDKIDSPHSLRLFSRVGATNPLYCTGLGKAMLAYADDTVIDKVVAAGFERRTENTITDEESLRAELARVRRVGYSVDDVENEEGVRCTGAPVFDHHGRAVAAFSVAGPVARMTRERMAALSPDVAAAGLELSRRLGYRPRA
jgi:IclR family acetate operon transcriptional repressor